MHATSGDPLWQTFRAWTPMHAATMALVTVSCVLAVKAGQAARERGPTVARRLDRGMAVVLMACWVALLGYFLMPSRLGWGQSLPLHVCHIVGFFAPVALWFRTRLARAMLYYWGLGLTTQALVTPVVTVGPAHGMFWVYWVWHGSLVTAALYDLAARRYRPGWEDWQLAAAAAFVYVPAAFAVDVLLGTDYGWVGQGMLSQWTLLSAFGPWPTRVAWMLLAGCGMMALLAIAWPRNRRWRMAVDAPQPFLVGPPVLPRLRPAA
jgi:hypothetical integral membrane protein (TIGR02206 family)